MKIRAVITAFKASWIASRCKTGCILDDENEVIIPCPVHSDEIARLAVINQQNWD